MNNLKNIRKYFIVFLVSAFPSAALALDCKSCEGKRAALQEKETEIQKLTDLLGKNREYLTHISPNQLSKTIKLDSNIRMILVRIEALRKDTNGLNSEMKKDGCESCKTNK